MNEKYRSCASVLVMRNMVSGVDLLLVHKPRKNDSWQLPQGGIEPGEALPEAALRELREETGLKPTEVIGISRQVYQYNYSADYRRLHNDNICGQRLNFVFVLLKESAEVVPDGQEIDDYRWVKTDQLDSFIFRPEYLETVKKVAAEGAEKLADRI